MEQIRNYVEGMFGSLPKTKAAAEAKREFIACLEEKYRSLVEEGKSGQEAMYAVLSQASNADDFKKVLGFDAADGAEAASTAPMGETMPILDPPPAADGAAYDREEGPMPVGGYAHAALQREVHSFQQKAWLATALSMLLIIAAPFASATARAKGGGQSLALLILGVGLALPLYFWGRASDCKRRVGGGADRMPQRVIEAVSHMDRKKLYPLIYSGTVVLYLFLGGFLGIWHPTWILFIMAVFAISLLESLRESTGKRKLGKNFHTTIYIGAVVIYLLMGTLFGIWHPTWMIFPFAFFVTLLLDGPWAGEHGRNK